MIRETLQKQIMKDYIKGAYRYLMGNKKLMMFNISYLTSGILIIIFSAMLFVMQGPVFTVACENSIFFVAMVILGFSPLYILPIANAEIRFLRGKEFAIRIIYGSRSRVYLQVVVENLFQLIASMILAVAITDLVFVFLNLKLPFGNIIASANYALSGTLVLWCLIGLLSAFTLIKLPGIQWDLCDPKGEPAGFAVVVKIVFAMQLISLISIAFSYAKLPNSFSGIHLFFYIGIILLGLHLIVGSYFVKRQHRSMRHNMLLPDLNIKKEQKDHA
jgi:hypothetical protein